jgi:hypothetical protein
MDRGHPVCDPGHWHFVCPRHSPEIVRIYISRISCIDGSHFLDKFPENRSDHCENIRGVHSEIRPGAIRGHHESLRGDCHAS